MIVRFHRPAHTKATEAFLLRQGQVLENQAGAGIDVAKTFNLAVWNGLRDGLLISTIYDALLLQTGRVR